MEGIADNSYDGCYAIEAICHAEDILKAYKQVFRVMKPGSKFVDCMVCMTNEYNCENPFHKKVKQQILVSAH